MEAQFNLNWLEFSFITGIEKNSVFEVASIFPTPSKGIFQIKTELKERENVRITIVNNSGQTVFEKEIGTTPSIEENVDISLFHSGIYYIVLKTESGESNSLKQNSPRLAKPAFFRPLKNNNMNKKRSISWKRILIFLIISITISNVFRFDIFELKTEMQQLPTVLFILIAVLLEGSGVFIAALIAIFLLKKKRSTETSLFGTSKPKSLIMAIIPIVLLSIIGVNNDFEMNVNFYGLIAGGGTLLYCIMEEYGWRGYLQEELKSLKPWQKYLTIGFIWYLWHLTFLTKATVGDNLFFLAMMIFGSWGIGQVLESTKSIMACACFHLIIQIMMFNALIKNGIEGMEKLFIIGVSVVLWFVMIKKWERESIIANIEQKN